MSYVEELLMHKHFQPSTYNIFMKTMCEKEVTKPSHNMLEKTSVFLCVHVCVNLVGILNCHF